MSSSNPPDTTVRFGEFAADLQAGELSRNASKIKLHGQPFEILAVLLEHPGRMVTREELRRRLWPADTFVDFEHGLNAAVNRLREALGDSAEEPRFIETIPRRGYKFIARVDGAPRASAGPSADADVHALRQRVLLSLGTVATLALAGLAVWLWAGRVAKVTAWTRLSFSGRASGLDFDSRLATDGSRIYFTAFKSGGKAAYVSVAGGDQVVLPGPLKYSFVRHISPDGSVLLVYETLVGERSDEGNLWLIPATGGGPRRLSSGHDGAWSPDGRQIVYAYGQKLYLADGKGGNSHELITAPGNTVGIRWSPDSKRMRFTLVDPKTGENSLWECRANGTGLHRLTLSRQKQAQECCGEWTLDGRYFLFTTIRENRRDLWVIRETGLLSGLRGPTQLTSGPLNAFAAIPGPGGKKLFVIGTQFSAELYRVYPKIRKILPFLEGISTGEAAPSPDGRWLTYTEIRDREAILWLSKADGSERLQLTRPPMEAGWQKWSSDGKQIAFMAKMPDRPWNIYLVPAPGGIPRALLPEEHSFADPEWSPDGHSLMFGRTPDNWLLEVSAAKDISILNLDTNRIMTLPGSEGLFSPRWSPDGRYVAAMPRSYRKLLLFDFATQSWSELASSTPENPKLFDTPRWSPDGEYVYFNEWTTRVVMRIARSSRKLEEVFDLKTADPNASLCRLHTIASDGALLIGCWFDRGDIYALDVELP